MQIRSILQQTTIIPVVMIADIDEAVPLAQALSAGGIHIIEVTLRTESALAAIKAIKDNLPNMIIAAGTIIKPQQLTQALDAGAHFGISPGLTHELAIAAQQTELPFMPGVTTTSEIMAAREWGFTTLKFFPAHINGGVAALSGWQTIFPDCVFCPTGGININNMNEYLNLNNVIAVGGSWLAPQQALSSKDWPKITKLAQESLHKIKN